MWTDRDLAPGDVIAGKYRVVRPLGRGGMGLVVQAEHVELGDQVAIKLLAPRLLDEPDVQARFLREAQSARVITSKHVVKVFDFGRLPSGVPYFVMELLQGEDLSHLVERRGPLPLEEACGYVRDACEAIAEAHHRGIVHRDLKPANLFLAQGRGGERTIKVLDFGIAKVRESAFSSERARGPVTETGRFLGTPTFMAPEQARGLSTADTRTDIWSLGIILFYLVTGRLPFSGTGLIDILLGIMLHDPEAPSSLRPELPAAFDRVVLRCLSKDPDLRFQTVDELVAALKAFRPQAASSPWDDDLAGVPSLCARSSVSAPSQPSMIGAGGDGDLLSITDAFEGARTMAAPPMAVLSALAARPAGQTVEVGCAPASLASSPPPKIPVAREARVSSGEPRRPRARTLFTAAIALAAGGLVVAHGAASDGDVALWSLASVLVFGAIVCSALALRIVRQQRDEAALAGGLSLVPASLAAAAAEEPGPAVTLSEELREYLARARVRVTKVSGRVHFLEPLPGSPVRRVRLAAVSFDDVLPPEEKTLSTKAFQLNVPEVLDFLGTEERPWNVLAVFRSRPAAGVYRMWNDLERRRVRILPVSPHLIRAALEADPGAHLNGMIVDAPPDPFDLPGSIPNELSELELFGSRGALQGILLDLERHCPSLGVFGFSRWGVTSLLRRIRLELDGWVTAWVDLKGLTEVSASSLLGEIHEKLRAALALPQSDRPPATAQEREEAIHHLLASRPPSDRRPILVFLDHVDYLGASGRGDNPDLVWTARCLYALTARDDGRPGLTILFGGHDDSLLTRRSFRIGEEEIKNPLWKCGRSHSVPFFTVEELSDFFARLGGMAGLSFSHAAVRAAHRLTGGHKYLNRRLGSLLFHDMKHRRFSGAGVEVADVERCGGALLAAESEYFDAITDHLPEDARVYLRKLAEPASAPPNAPRASMEPPSELLRSYSLVARDPVTGSVEPTIGLLSMWLRSRAPVTGILPPAPPQLVLDDHLGVRALSPSDPPSQGPNRTIRMTAIRPHGRTFASIAPGASISSKPPPDRRSSPSRADIFIACAAEDEPMGRELERGLHHFLEQAGITLWAEWHRKPGTHASEVGSAIANARLFLVLLSTNFFGEARCKSDLLPRMKVQTAARGATLIPIILKPCVWKSDPEFGHLAPLPRDGIPVDLWPHRDAAWQNVIENLLPIARERCLPQQAMAAHG